MLPYESAGEQRKLDPWLTPGARALAAYAALALAWTPGCSGGGGGSSGGGGAVPPGVALNPFALQADGAPADLEADGDTVWVAGGRRLAVIDAATLERLPQLESEYPRTLTAVELDGASGDLLILEEGALYRRSPSTGPEELLWTAPSGVKLQDVALAAGHALVLSTKKLYDLELDGSGAALAHEVDLHQGDRGAVLRSYLGAGGSVRAVIVVQTQAADRLINGLALFELAPGDATPVLSKTWMPNLTSPEASVESVVVLPGAGGAEDRAWVTAGLRSVEGGTAPYVEILDVTDVEEPRHLVWVDLAGGGTAEAAHQIAADPDGGRVFVTTDRGLYTVDAVSRATLGSLPADFDLERSAPVLQPYPLGLRLWSVERNPLQHNFRTFDVTGDEPELLDPGWWWCGSDTAVFAPAWRSIYLTTFGGVVRYDVSDPAQPKLVGGHFPSAGSSYAPATDVTEDADLLDAGAASRLLVARGGGGIDAFPVSAAAPDPGPPTTMTSSLPHFTYNNAVRAWKSPSGVHYALTDATTAPPGGTRYFLEAARYDPLDGGFEWVAATVPVAPPPEIETPLTSNLAVAGHFAFVGARGMFFVVDLAHLPGSLPIADLVTVAHPGEGNVFVRGIAPAGDYLYVCIRGDGAGKSVFAVYGFDQVTGNVSELPLATVQAGDPGVPDDFALFDRAHLGPGGKTVLACGAQGRLLAFGIEDPLKPYLADTWQDPGQGTTSDCRLETFTFPGGEQRQLVVFVTMAETFKLIAVE